MFNGGRTLWSLIFKVGSGTIRLYGPYEICFSGGDDDLVCVSV